MIFWPPRKDWYHFASSALCCTLSSCLSAHPMVLASPIHWGFLLQVGFTNRLSIGSLHGAKPQLLCMTPSVLGSQLKLRLHFHQWPSMASHNVKSQLFFMTPSCLQNQNHLGDSYTLPSTDATGGTTLAISGTQFLCAFRKHFSEDFTSVMLVSS